MKNNKKKKMKQYLNAPLEIKIFTIKIKMIIN